jgi:hypothetical protein
MRRGAGALKPARALLAAAPVFFFIRDEPADTPREFVAKFIDVDRHRIVVGLGRIRLPHSGVLRKND